jgi:hypothetical protein
MSDITFPGMVLRIGLGIPHQYADTPHPAGLLRLRRQRPRSRAAEKANELAPPHIRTQPQGPARAQTGHQNHCRSAQPMSEMGHFPALPRRSIFVRFIPISGHQRERRCRFFVACRPLVVRVLQGSGVTRTAPALILSRVSGGYCEKS